MNAGETACFRRKQELRRRNPQRFPGLQGEEHTVPVSRLGPVLVAAPHPDDESLGCGGVIAYCARLGVPVTVLAMTNGEASHPGDAAWREQLADMRSTEQSNALQALGMREPDIVRLHIDDGGLDKLDVEEKSQIIQLIAQVLMTRQISAVFVPSIDDRHSDHRETARLVASAIRSHPVAYFFSYQIWQQENREPHFLSCERRFCLDITDVLQRKGQAVSQHHSQMGGLGPDRTNGFQMPTSLLNSKLKEIEEYYRVTDIRKWSM